MARGKKHSPEQVVNLLRQIEVAVANGKTTPLACKEAGIVEQTYFRWRKEYGGLQVDQARRLKELEQENSKLKRLVPQRRDLLLHERDRSPGRTLASALQHHQAALVARLQSSGASSLANINQRGACKSGKPTALPTFAHPRLRLSIFADNCATLTIQPAQMIGQTSEGEGYIYLQHVV